MEEVKAYRCGDCDGKGYVTYTSKPLTDTNGREHCGISSSSTCWTCKGSKIVWLTKKEVEQC